ncbi:Ig-like domain-containing protein [Demequina sp. NBRC 110056]|uniref:Ig-like domain-containing protein n=1 Tax=Demequina sp. NBRC 110056 TaxID=1570345 RepID=UPI0009FC488F|nr:Ig-like domain-containing protein [Demequina sp. NBRC 110056]
MAQAQPEARRRRPALWWTAGALVATTAVTGAVLADGYDEQEVPRVEESVWVTRDDGRYARVNTELGEIDTVRAVAEPAGVVQSGPSSVVFTQGYAQAWPIDPAAPLDLTSGDDGAASGAALVAGTTPTGTEQVLTGAGAVVYLTSVGEVSVTSYPEPGEPMAAPRTLDPSAGVVEDDEDQQETFAADAVAIDDAGTVAMLSLAEGAVWRYDLASGSFEEEPTPVPSPPGADSEPSLTLAGGRWALLDAESSRLWVEGLDEPTVLQLGDDPALQATSSDLDAVLVADASGLVSVDTATGQPDRVVTTSGVPAAPVVVDGRAHAAWVTGAGGSLWDGEREETVALEVEAGAFDDVQSPSPVFRTNGDRAVLTETATGSLWTVPDGLLLPSADWDPVEDTDEVLGEVSVDDVIEQEPPVAVDDAFGVRAGSVVSLPLLYNDHDPNAADVLSIDPASVSAVADPAFGAVSLVSEDQSAVISVAATSGTSTFTYAVTDGYGLSEPATVTLTVIPDESNEAPVWCGVEACTQEWPSPQVAPGGFAEVDVLAGWVDPDGDALALTDAHADDPDAPLTVIPTEAGTVAIRHHDPNGSEGVIPLTVTVTDAHGEQATRALRLQVTSAPALEVRPVAVTGGLDQTTRVAIADHVRGGSGSYRLVDAVVSQGGDDVLVTPLAANGTIELSALAAGRYAATFTVEDTVTRAQSSATLRYSVAETPRPLSLPPLTTFVRAQEDATVDVLATAQDSSGRVLMVAAATSAEPQLSVSVVGTSFVRVSGSTASGDPGLVGTADVTVADGAGNTASTQLTVFLLPPAQGLGPIAMPDAVTVRAGSQVDIPVLANDTGPRGERLMLDPAVEGSGDPDELAFGSGKLLRYLAPTTPGTYTLRYSTFIESDASRTDTSSVTITVLPAGSNRAPEPPTLTARVLKGQVVRIPFTGAGVDPDGDAVSLVDVSQPGPALGTAQVSASGAAILYRAPLMAVPGGQVAFTYSVIDEQGEPATGTVRIGVLDTDVSDVAPVTYSDYLSAQLGSPDALPVEPLLNDTDPLQGELSLIDIRPAAEPGSAEYDRLDSLIDRGAFDADGTVLLEPGDVAGTHSYLYTVESPVSLSTAEGRIVVDVSEAANPPTLRIQDTVVTARTRHDLAAGIDVVTGKVQWPGGGDVSGLALELWDDAPAGFTVQGWTISGDLPRQRTIVPFSLTGLDATGATVTSYGFLRIPALDEMRLQPALDLAPVVVDEDESVEFDVHDLLDLTPADRIDVRQDPSFAVQRSAAACAPAGGDRVRYSAGREAPWADTCSVAVRLSSQDTWSVVAFPISIVPQEPQAILGPLSRTIRPAESDSVDLVGELVSWEGDRVGDVSALALTTAYDGAAFDITSAGGTLTATARADAVPGTREVVRVRSAAFGGLTTTITLVVGSAPVDAPRGATFSQSCDVSAGPRCTISVVGVGGEYDPFAGAEGGGLTLTRVGGEGTVTCPAATVTQANATQIVATWPAGQRPEGGECTVPFTVADAQGRTGPGTLTLDVRGYPKPPASVTTVAYTGTSVTLDVALGPAAQAQPRVSSVVIHRSGSPVAADCSAASASTYRCVVAGLVNGERASFTARAVNAIGESLDSSAHTTWAYEAPVIASVTASPVHRSPGTTSTQGVVSVTIEASADTRAFAVSGTDQTFPRTGPTTTFETVLPVGPQNLQVTPISEFAPPLTGDNRGQATSAPVTVAGSPSYTSSISAVADGTRITVSGGAFQANSSALPTTQIWYAWTGARPTCSMDDSGRAAVTGADHVASSTAVITGLQANTTYNVAVCGSNGYGRATSNDVTAYTWIAPTSPDGDATYRVATAWQAQGTRAYAVALESGPTLTAPAGFSIAYWYDGAGKSSTFQLRADLVQTITAAACSRVLPDLCGAPRTIAPAPGSPPAPVTVTFPAAPGVTHPDGSSQAGCFPEGTADASAVSVTAAARGAATVIIEGTEFVVDWTGAFADLPQLRHAFTVCDPPPDVPDPTPSAEPSDTP